MGTAVIAKPEHLEGHNGRAGLSLLCAAGQRPSTDDIARLLAKPPPPGAQRARVSHRPKPDEGWLELLASGLTFDLVGLAPAPPAPTPAARHFFGWSEQPVHVGLEAIALLPGAHVAAGASLLPVVRVMTALAARIVGAVGVRAVCWHPACSLMEPGYFTRIISSWLDSGPFPALGLTAVEETDGEVRSSGLAFFTGQELRIQLTSNDAGLASRLIVRSVAALIGQGALRERVTFAGPAAEVLVAEPEPGGRMVTVRRG